MYAAKLPVNERCHRPLCLPGVVENARLVTTSEDKSRDGGRCGEEGRIGAVDFPDHNIVSHQLLEPHGHPCVMQRLCLARHASMRAQHVEEFSTVVAARFQTGLHNVDVNLDTGELQNETLHVSCEADGCGAQGRKEEEAIEGMMEACQDETRAMIVRVRRTPRHRLHD